MKSILIGDRRVGRDQPCLVIAEAGVNHNGNLKTAKELISCARASGAHCVKFQTFKADQLVLLDAPKAEYQLKVTDRSETQYDMLKRLELKQTDYEELIGHCVKEGIQFLSTPYNIEDVDLLADLGVDAYKLASIHAAEPSFVQYVAKKGKPIILSTGMATLSEIDQVVRAVYESGNCDLILLQCTTNYPSTTEDANIRAMRTLQETFGLTVGYSDHTEDNIACILAIALGAKVIEKHFTLDRSMPGPDQKCSLQPDEFRQLSEIIGKAEKGLGSAIKRPTELERSNTVGMRRSIVAKRNINENTIKYICSCLSNI